MLSSVCLKIEMEKPAPIVWHSAHWEPKMQHVWRGALLLLSFWSLLQNWSKTLITQEASTCTLQIWFYILLIPNPEKEFLSFLTVDNWPWGAILWAASQTPARDTGLDGSIFADQRGVNLTLGKHPTAGHYSHDYCRLRWWSSKWKHNHVWNICEWNTIKQLSPLQIQNWKKQQWDNTEEEYVAEIMQFHTSKDALPPPINGTTHLTAVTKRSFSSLGNIQVLHYTVIAQQSSFTLQVAAGKQLFIAEWSMINSPVQGPG